MIDRDSVLRLLGLAANSLVVGDAEYSSYPTNEQRDLMLSIYRQIDENVPEELGRLFARMNQSTSHQDGVIQEKTDLDERHTKLKMFLANPEFQALDPEEQGRLVRQAAAMANYSEVLTERIKAF